MLVSSPSRLHSVVCCSATYVSNTALFTAHHFLPPVDLWHPLIPLFFLTHSLHLSLSVCRQWARPNTRSHMQTFILILGFSRTLTLSLSLTLSACISHFLPSARQPGFYPWPKLGKLFSFVIKLISSSLVCKVCR